MSDYLNITWAEVILGVIAYLLLDSYSFLIIGEKFHLAYLNFTKSLRTVILNRVLAIPPVIFVSAVSVDPGVLAGVFLIASIFAFVISLKIYFHTQIIKGAVFYVVHTSCSILMLSVLIQLLLIL